MSDSRPDESALQFRRLLVDRMYGQRFGLSLDGIGNGVNVIAGPNGSGKTTLARAIEVLVWPRSHRWESPIVDGSFQLGGDRWRISVESSRLQREKEGGTSGTPAVPPPSHRDRYHLYLHDLLSATEGSEQDLVEAILTEAQGGYDASAAASELGLGDYARGKLNETRDLTGARRQVEEAKEKQRQLEKEQRTLDELERKLEEAREAAARRDAFAQAIKLKNAEEEAQSAEEELSEFPSGMDAVQGDEAERLSNLRAERQEEVGKKEDAEQEIEEAEQEIENNRIPKDGLPDGTLETLRNAVQEWEQAQNSVDQAKRDRERLEETEEEEWNRLRGEEKDQVADISLPALDEVQSYAESRLELKGDEEALGAMERLFGEAEPDIGAETLRRGLERLEEWLREPDPSGAEETGEKLRYGGIVLSVIVAAIGVWLATGGAVLGWAVVAVGLALAIVIYVLGRSTAPDTRRPGVRERFERLGLEGPETWSVEPVQRRLDSLLQDWTDAKIEKAKADEWSRRKSERDQIEEKKKELAEQKEELTAEIGVDPDIDGHSLLWFVQRLGAWQKAHTDLQAKGEELKEAKAQAERWRGKVQELVRPYGFEEISDIADGKAALEQLRDDQQALGQALTALDNAEDSADQAEAQIEKIGDKIEEIFERLDLPVGDDSAVQERCDRLEDYEEAKKKAQSASQKVSHEKERLRSEEGFEESMLTAETEELEERKEKAAALAEEEEELSDRISRIQQKVDTAKEEHDLEDVLAEREAARKKLDRRRREDIQSVVGQALAEVVHRRTRNQDLPEVFGRADELFRRITTDRYHLDLDRENGTLRAVTGDDQWLGLSELSSGTKVQLLLAMRIAFVERQEQGTRLPLVLDETLANSDDMKARSVIEAVRTICSEGRQIFYLTAQSDEVAKWQDLLNGSGTDLTLHRLSGDEATASGELHQLGGDGAPSSGRPTGPELPDPEEVDHADLEDVLDVPRWSPRSPVGELPLWYLTSDTDFLCRAAEKSYRTWGQVSSLAERDALPLIGLPEKRHRQMEALARAVQAWREAWLIGRGEPVGRPALEETGAVSENFIERVTDLAAEVDGQAERILEELRGGAVKRFRSGKIEELRAYFREEGHLSEREPLSLEACWRRATAEVSDEITENLITEGDVEVVLDRICNRAGV